ncbi:MAG TPA: hypothetical protein VK859_16985 [bacterium]|jgi:hypothetical protein|nr:hypothetical protein [bacterium]
MVIVWMIARMVVMVVIVMRGFVMASFLVVVDDRMVRMIHRVVIRQHDSNPSHEQKAHH